jgi:hypothetical protein
LFKPLLNIFKADEIHWFDFAKIVPMMSIMGVVIPYYTTIITGMQTVVYISQVVTSHFACDFSTQISRHNVPLLRVSEILCVSAAILIAAMTNHVVAER